MLVGSSNSYWMKHKDCLSTWLQKKKLNPEVLKAGAKRLVWVIDSSCCNSLVKNTTRLHSIDSSCSNSPLQKYCTAEPCLHVKETSSIVPGNISNESNFSTTELWWCWWFCSFFVTPCMSEKNSHIKQKPARNISIMHVGRFSSS